MKKAFWVLGMLLLPALAMAEEAPTGGDGVSNAALVKQKRKKRARPNNLELELKRSAEEHRERCARSGRCWQELGGHK